MTTSVSEPAILHVTDADREIASTVERALWDEPILRGGHSAIEVSVEQGVVTLRGHVLGLTAKAQAIDVARHVRGVRKVVEHLVGDDQLEIEVAQALAHDARTRGDNIRVYVHQGAVDLHGPVGSAECRAAAEDIAAHVPHVRAVVNHLELPEAPATMPEPRLVEPRAGQAVTATDMLLGSVERVIVNPHDRRVTALVVHGRFPDLLQWEPAMYPDEMPKLERRVLIPIDAVHNVGEGGVMLRVSGVDAACYVEYDAAQYIAPAGEPEVPYPYDAGEILFERSVTGS